MGLDETKFNAFTETLFKMDYNNPEHKEMMDLEGLKRWVAAEQKVLLNYKLPMNI